MNAIGLYYFTESKEGQGVLRSENKSDIKYKLGEHPSIAELHINVWKVERGNVRLKSEIFIDFGIMTSFKVKKLCLYLPFSVEEPTDLGRLLNNKKRELCAIFNDELLPEPQKNGCYCKVKFEDNVRNEYFYLYELGGGNISVAPFVEKFQKGTYVTLEMKGNPSDAKDDNSFLNEKRYVRFRVKVIDRKDICITSHISNDLLQAAFSMSDYYDIRINEKREIPDKVKEYMQSNKFDLCKFNKVHLFYMADSRENIENESSLKCDSRLLEACQWKDYEPQTEIDKPIFIAHHWKRRADKDDFGKIKTSDIIHSFSVFFSTIYPCLSWIRLLTYMFVVILLGWFG